MDLPFYSKNNMEKWNEYTKEHFGTTWFPKEILDRYAQGRILDLGCGLGDHLGSIKNFREKYGIDISELAIETAKKRHSDCSFILNLLQIEEELKSLQALGLISENKVTISTLCQKRKN